MLYIGTDMQNRMDLLGLTVNEVAEKTFLEESFINAILCNEVAFEDVDEFDLNLICSVLHCKPEYFTDESVKSKDLLLVSMNRGCETKQSRMVKAKIQDFMNDFAFVDEVLAELG